MSGNATAIGIPVIVFIGVLLLSSCAALTITFVINRGGWGGGYRFVISQQQSQQVNVGGGQQASGKGASTGTSGPTGGSTISVVPISSPASGDDGGSVKIPGVPIAAAAWGNEGTWYGSAILEPGYVIKLPQGIDMSFWWGTWDNREAAYRLVYRQSMADGSFKYGTPTKHWRIKDYRFGSPGIYMEFYQERIIDRQDISLVLQKAEGTDNVSDASIMFTDRMVFPDASLRADPAEPIQALRDSKAIYKVALHGTT